jgi:hypothetical protein
LSDDKILEVPALTKPFSEEVSDANMRELGLLSMMPAVFFHSIGTAEALESYRKLLRSRISFQVVVFAAPEAIENFKIISAPAAHPIKFLSDLGQAGDYVRLCSAVVTDSLSYGVIEQAALHKKPVIAVNCEESSADFVKLAAAGLVACARVPAETLFLTENSIQKKKTSDTEKMFAYLANSQAQTPLADALGQVMPDNELRISNYQEKPR